MLRDKNSLGENSFYVLCGVFTVAFSVSYIHIFMLPMLIRSKLVLFLVELLVYSTGTTLFNKRRNIMTAVTVGLMTPVIFFGISYYHVAGVRIAIALGVGVALSAAYALAQFKYSKSKGSKKRRMILLGAVSLIVFSMGTSLVIPVGDFNAAKIIENKNNDQYEFSTYREEANLDHNMETVSKLDPSLYPSLEAGARMETIQVLARVEQNYLGISGVNIKYENLGKNTLGKANYEKNTVYINEELLKEESSENLVETLLHELYHLYTFRVIQVYQKLDREERGLLLFRVAEMSSQDMENYQDGDEDFEAYANQTCEYAARSYAEEGTKEIFERIAEYLRGGENDDRF